MADRIAFAALALICAALMSVFIAFAISVAHYEMAPDGKPAIIEGYPLCSAANSFRCN